MPENEERAMVPPAEEPGAPAAGSEARRVDDFGPLLDPAAADTLEAEDRKKPIPGGEPACPMCGSPMIRHVEAHPAPRGGASPFRVRLVCSSDDCRAWTVYDW